MIIELGIKLYHGSYTMVDAPDISMCGKGKNFGQGFYVTTDIGQGRRIVKSAIGKAIKNGLCDKGRKSDYVSVYEFTSLVGIKIYEFDSAEFDSADRKWLHCVAMHRRDRLFSSELGKWMEYDIIGGKIANDKAKWDC